MRCPTCGNEVNPFVGSPLSQQEFYARQMAQQQNMNQIAGYGMQNNPIYGGSRLGSMQCGSPGIDYAAEELPKPESKPTAWKQFKELLGKLIP